MKALVLNQVTIMLRASHQALIHDLSLSVAPGEVTTIMGASGSGKSTLLNFIGGHLDPAFVAQGQVSIGDRVLNALPAEARQIGFLFQDDMLFPHLSVGSNLAFGLAASVRGRRLRRERVEAALSIAGLSGFYDRDPATLSGGQRARAALMRTLLAEPKALLLDEPFSKLDQEMRDDMRRFVFEHAREQDLPVLLVTHDEADARAASGPIVRLQG
ncbi:ATP-binding cassette domain-containing protein [Rhizobium sp. L1K21]|uniref:ATP-binding cassette domain-containing protein n=1 Tax=Rhizobium sp. L1K21 TaxID=2954933 RepID=UPI002092B6D1|nr:ATP-binding cassette domain-containing protein [Rhizobium sp. L1K21]MCO6184755.1 ATP-binding cassette domain-containing protein [Rhizobium sp. L1K21]